MRDGRWTEARSGLAGATTADAFELRGALAYLLGDSKGYFDDLTAAFRAHDTPDRAARTAAWLGVMHLIRGEAAHSRGWFTQSRRLVDEHGECAASAYLRVLPIIGDQTSGREQAIATTREVNAIAHRYDDLDAVALTGQTLGQLLIRTGQVDEGRDLMDEAMVMAMAGQLSSPLVEVLVLLAVMEGCRLLVDLERSREWGRTVARFRNGHPELVAFLGVFALDDARLAFVAGDWDGSLAALDAVDPALVQEASRLREQILRARGGHLIPADFEPVRRALATATDACDRAPLLPEAVEMLAPTDLTQAEVLAAELDGVARQFASPLLAGRGRLAEATVAQHAGDLDRALAAVDGAITAFERLQVLPDLARARSRAVAIHHARGEDSAAALEQAALETLASELGITAPTATPASMAAGHSPVSARELDVLRLLAGGATNREIATALTLSIRTVDRHVSNIFTKIGVTTRAAAAAWAVERGHA